MPLDTDGIIVACKSLAREEKLNICIHNRITDLLKYSTITCTGMIIFSVFSGLRGIAIGHFLGNAIGYYSCGTFKPVLEVIDEMSLEDQERLAKHIRRVLKDIHIRDAITLMELALSPAASKRRRRTLVDAMEKFLNQGAFFQRN